MRRKHLAAFLVSMIVMLFSINARAQLSGNGERDTDTRLVNAKVMEITDSRLSVMAQTGVEHVIAIDMEKTSVTRDGQNVSVKEVREGDIITIELDEKNPVKFAKNISMRNDATAVARNRR
ncbi:MAG TPA: hypothetical protein VGO69_00595 [Pyrinomonadaceae bacterium]|jgi:hypothetical protein|nr:hypothetical protein [Pyrinomonadaceae bacterium]